jgi:hypothetical protein
MGRYDKGPYGTILGGVNMSIAGMLIYLWEITLIVIFGLGIALDWETAWLDPSLLWAGGPFCIIIFAIGTATLKKWSFSSSDRTDAANLKILRIRRAELAHFLHSGIIQILLGVFWVSFVVHWSLTPPLPYEASPLLWSIKTALRALSIGALLTSFGRVLDTNLVKWSMFTPRQEDGRPLLA